MDDEAGAVTVSSGHPFDQTVERVCAAAVSAGYRVFSRVDHAANAAGVGMVLPPTVLVLFGKPDVGTVLMQARRTTGLDLPSRILVWEDEVGAVRLTYRPVPQRGLDEAGTAAARTLTEAVERICADAA